MPPLLSIVLPNYNHGEFLPRSLGAILPQLDDRMELIVVDDASGDGSPEVILGLLAGNPRARLIAKPENSGVIAAFRTGWEAASPSSRYLYLAGADDWIEPGFLTLSLDLLLAHPEAGLCASQARIFLPNGTERIDSLGLPSGYASGEAFLERARAAGRLAIPSNTVVLRRDAFLAYGGYDEALGWHCDWFVNTLLALRHGLVFLPETLSAFVEHPGGYSTHGPRQKTLRAAVVDALLRRIASFPQPGFAFARRAFREPALVAFAEDAHPLWLSRVVRHPRSWPLLSGALLASVIRERCRARLKQGRRFLLNTVRPAAWSVLWGTGRLVPGRYGIRVRHGLLRAFGAGREEAEACARTAPRGLSEPWKTTSRTSRASS